MEFILSMVIGVSLSATSGFRVFVPLLVLSIASLVGWVELSPAFAWIGSYSALSAFAVATLLELGAYFFPFIDNLLSLIATPVSLLAGTIITASLLVDLPPLLTWSLAIVAGGGAALGGSTVSNLLHGGSTAATGGAANPAVSLVESLFSLVVSILAVLVPVLALVLLVILALITVRMIRRLGARRARVRNP